MPTYNGISYPETDFLDYGYKTTVTSGTGVSLPRWQAALVDAIADAGKQMRGTSVTSNSIATGTLTFVLDNDLPFGANESIWIFSTVNRANNMFGTVTSYTQSTKTLVVSITDTNGSGSSLTAWAINSAGPKGATGTTGASYDISASTAITTTATGYTLAISDGAGSVHNKKITLDNFLATLTLPIKVQQFSETSSAVTAASTTVLDFTLGTVFDMAHGTNITTFTWSNPAASGKATGFVLKRTKDNSGTTRTIAWPASVKWVAGAAPTLTQTANAVDMFVFITIDGGTTYDGYVAGLGLA